jgi:hypothetical protein
VIAMPESETPGRKALDGEERTFRIAVLASGSGSNLQALIDELHHPPSRSWVSTKI